VKGSGQRQRQRKGQRNTIWQRWFVLFPFYVVQDYYNDLWLYGAGNSSAEEIVKVERSTAWQKAGSEKKGSSKLKKVSPRQHKGKLKIHLDLYCYLLVKCEGKPFKSSSMIKSNNEDKNGSDDERPSEKPVLKRPRTSTDGEWTFQHIILACKLISLSASSRPRQRQAISHDISRGVSQALSVTGLGDKLASGSRRSNRPSPATSATRLTRHSSRSGADASRKSTPIQQPISGPSVTSDDIEIEWDVAIPQAAAPPPQNNVKKRD